MHTSRTLPRPGKADESEERRPVDECAPIPLALLPRLSLPLPFIKTLKFLEQLRNDNLARRWNCGRGTAQFMSPAFFHREKTDQVDPLVTREKFLPVSSDEWKRQRERERKISIHLFILLSLTLYLSLTLRWFLFRLEIVEFEWENVV